MATKKTKNLKRYGVLHHSLNSFVAFVIFVAKVL